jgi:hypothetical protein
MRSGPIDVKNLSKREIDQMIREKANQQARLPIPGRLVPAHLTEEEKRRKAEEIHREIFGDRPVPGKGTVPPAAEGVRAGAEAPASGQKIARSSAAARAPQGRGPAGPQSNKGSTGSFAPEGPETGPAEPGPEETEIPEHLKSKPNKRENEFMLNLMVLRNTLLRNGPACRERAKLAGKWVWRDIRLATVLIDRIQEALLRTMPASREEYYTAYAHHGHYELHIDGPIRMPRQVLITDKHLGTICEAAMLSECIMCIREGNEIDHCELRDALLETAAPTAIQKGDSPFRKCEYKDAASQLLHGKDVTL